MSYNPTSAMNNLIRATGNRARGLPDIGQGSQQPAPTANPPQPPPQPPGTTPIPGLVPMQGMAPQQPAPTPPPAPPVPPTTAPMGVNPQTFTMHPPGAAADAGQYNYEPQPDGSWRVYPPGVTAPPHTHQASMPRAASTADFIRMSRAFTGPPNAPAAQSTYPQPMQAPQIT
jgi:hypothetical protein